MIGRTTPEFPCFADQLLYPLAAPPHYFLFAQFIVNAEPSGKISFSFTFDVLRHFHLPWFVSFIFSYGFSDKGT